MCKQSHRIGQIQAFAQTAGAPASSRVSCSSRSSMVLILSLVLRGLCAPHRRSRLFRASPVARLPRGPGCRAFPESAVGKRAEAPPRSERCHGLGGEIPGPLQPHALQRGQGRGRSGHRPPSRPCRCPAGPGPGAGRGGYQAAGPRQPAQRPQCHGRSARRHRSRSQPGPGLDKPGPSLRDATGSAGWLRPESPAVRRSSSRRRRPVRR